MQNLKDILKELNLAKASDIKIGASWISFILNNNKYFIESNNVIMYNLINRRLYIKHNNDISYIKNYDSIIN